MLEQSLMTYFRGLDHDTRVHALVGHYLKSWAFMELELDDAIAKALGLTGLQQYVLRCNMFFHNKADVLRSLISLSYMNEKEKEHYSGVVNDMLGYTAHRNRIAHDIFVRSKTNDGVMFLVFKAKGKVEFPEFDWSVEKFVLEFRKLDKAAAQMQELQQKINIIPASSLAGLLSGAALSFPPTPPPLGLGSLVDRI